LEFEVKALVVEREEGWRTEKAPRTELQELRTQREREGERMRRDIESGFSALPPFPLPPPD
jgi:hypothetical protein